MENYKDKPGCTVCRAAKSRTQEATNTCEYMVRSLERSAMVDSEDPFLGRDPGGKVLPRLAQGH